MIKIKVLGFGERHGKKIAKKINDHIKDTEEYSFEFFQNLEISFGYLSTEDKQIIVEGIPGNELDILTRLIEFLQRLCGKSKSKVTHGVLIRFPDIRPTKSDKAVTRILKGNPIARLIDVREILP